MMYRVRVALSRVRELFRHRSDFVADQNEEFSFHIEMETAENIRRGMSEADARRAALLRFGGAQRFREETSDARGVAAIDNLVRDTRFALRRLRRAPGFAIGVIATLGIGIGAAVGIGTIVYGVLLRDLPYDKPDQLVRVDVFTDGLGPSTGLQSAATYFHFAKSAQSFAEVGGYYTNDSFVVTDGDAPERVTIASITPNILTLLRVRPILGHLFETRDTSWTDGSHRIPILISENLWRRRYGSDSSIIGRQIDINHGERIVIGVLPRSFAFPTPSIDLFYPAPIPVRRPEIAPRYMTVIGRLHDGVSPSAAQSELNALVPTLTDRFPTITRDLLQRSRARVSVASLKAATVASVHAQLVLLGVLVAVVLLIATTNVVNLFLLRAERASAEIAIALSLGATRVALAQRFVIEGVVLGLASTIVALPATALALSTKFGFTEREIPRLHEVSFSWGTFTLVLGCALLIGAAVGLIALTRTEMSALFDRLRTSRSTSTRTWRRAQNGLVAFQVAIALVLLVATGLLGRSFWNLRTAKIGFEPENAMTFQVSLPWDTYRWYGEHAAFHARLSERLSALPGVTSVGVASRLPLASAGTPRLDMELQADGDETRPVISAAANRASVEYFKTMGIPLRAGRTFRSGDVGTAPAVVVSERVAKSLFGTTDVVGRVIKERLPAGSLPQGSFTIVGVVGDVHWERIEDGYVPMVYLPLLRDGDGLSNPGEGPHLLYEPRDVQYAIRGTRLPSAAVLQEIVKDLDRRIPAANIRTLGSLVDTATARVRLTMLLIAITGISALLLGVIGVYSVVAYAANGRVREFGIRLALGAAPSRIGRLVLGDGFKLVAIGTVTGLLAALGTTRFLRALLYEVEPTGVAEFGVATALLVLVTLVATLLPARRAARTHPAVVLRGE
jgi:predicted permease